MAPPVTVPRVRFSQRFIAAVHAVGGALFAGAEGPPPDDRLEYLAADVEDYLRNSGFQTRTLFRLSLLAVFWIAPLLFFRLPMSWQDWQGRVAILERAERGIFGMPVLMLKAILCASYYEHPDAFLELNVSSDCLRAP